MGVAEVDVYPWIGLFEGLCLSDRLSIAQLVFSGGAVVGTVKQLTGRLKKARMLALLREQETDRIVCVAALKSPDPKYRLKKFEDAGVEVANFESAPELATSWLPKICAASSCLAGWLI